MNTNPIRAIIVMLLAGSAVAGAETLTRGPYLQMAGPDAMTIRWQTDEAADSKVQYGAAAAKLDQTAGSKEATREHEVRLTGLKPATTYYYSVGNSAAQLAGGDESFHFKTAPAAGSDTPTRIWVLGDSGTGKGDGKSGADKVRDGYEKSKHYKQPDVWLMLGDNAYDKGSEEETTRAIFNTYPKVLRNVALWSAFGNHESYTDKGAPYFNAFSFPQAGESGGKPSGTEAYYSFDHGNIHFVCLDSETGKNRAVDGAMMTWLKADLEATGQKWLIAFFHHPPYTKGSHDSDTERAHIEMRERFLPVLEAHGVDLVLGGHSHSYERTMLIDGHYGMCTTFEPGSMAKNAGSGRVDDPAGAYKKASGANHGAVYIVGGNSGKASGGKLNHPAMVISKSLLGSVAIDIQGDRMDVKEIDDKGELIDDFSIIKGK